jgi:plasmid replication initiation protein
MRRETNGGRLLHHSEYNKGEGTLTLRFHDELKPALLQLKERFTQIPLKTVFRLQGGYAIRWFEMCKAKEYLGTFNIER